MLGKQWLNRYQSTEMRGTAIERSQNRQRKLDGIVAWYFDYVMESLPLMLQVALLLLGCALSRYLWEVNTTVAAVLIGFTSLGLLFYIFIVIAGTISENCPYQTPAARIFRHILTHYASITIFIGIVTNIAIKFSNSVRDSSCYFLFTQWWSDMEQPWYSMSNICEALFSPIFLLFIALPFDVYSLGRATLRLLIIVGKKTYHQLIVPFYRTAYRRFVGAFTPQTHGLGQQAIVLDLRCVSWVLKTSLDKLDHLSAFNHLWSMPELGKFDPILVVECFNGFNSSIGFSNGRVVVIPGLEYLAEVAVMSFYRTLCHLTAMDPTSNVLADLRRRYNKVFSPRTDFSGVQFWSTMELIHALASQPGNPKNIQWNKHQLPSVEHTPFARCMVEAAQVGLQRTQGRKVPRWILRFALDSLSRDPPSPIFVVTSSLAIIAIDLGCDVSTTITLYWRYVRL